MSTIALRCLIYGHSLRDSIYELHDLAWGRQWPRRTGCILRKDVVPANELDDDAMDVDEDAHSSLVVGGAEVPERFDYVCLEGMRAFARALQLTSDVQDVLVVRQEYDVLLRVMDTIEVEKAKTHGIVVVGHPGIG